MSEELSVNKETISEIIQAIAEVKHHDNIRKRHGALGRFDISQYLNSIGSPLPQDDNAHDNVEHHESTTDNSGANTQSKTKLFNTVKDYVKHETTRKSIHGPLETTINGKTIATVDYAIMWPGLDPSTQDSTHEITCFRQDSEFIWVSGMMDNQIAKIRVTDPTDQYFFRFPPENGKGVQPHTLRFDKFGALWVGLEYAGKIVKLKNLHTCGKRKIMLSRDENYAIEFDVRIQGNGGSIPCAINTHPHGFCFDHDKGYIWFTGKLTNTVGRVHMETGQVKHYELPTLGAVPIYVSLGPDKNIWGTCLANNNIFRVTTDDNPIVTEIQITATSENRRPIAIKEDPRGEAYMWFSTEAGHTVGRIDCDQVEAYVQSNATNIHENCTCSKIFYASSGMEKAITEFVVPRPGPDMLLAGFAFDDEGNLWTQSYVDSHAPESSEGPDYIVRIDKSILGAKTKKSGKGQLTGIPFEYYELPTRNTILHRIIKGPEGVIWFTELGADRIGNVKFL